MGANEEFSKKDSSVWCGQSSCATIVSAEYSCRILQNMVDLFLWMIQTKSLPRKKEPDLTAEVVLSATILLLTMEEQFFLTTMEELFFLTTIAASLEKVTLEVAKRHKAARYRLIVLLPQ